MRTEIQILTESGMTVGDVGTNYPASYFLLHNSQNDSKSHPENILSSTDVKGFPIVSSDRTRTIVGYIGRTELRYVLGMSFSALVQSIPSDEML
jgi:hypothetical protein